VKDQDRKFLGLLFASLGIAVVLVLWWNLRVLPYQPQGYYSNTSHFYRLLLAGLSIALVLGFTGLSRLYPNISWPWRKNAPCRDIPMVKIYFSILIFVCFLGFLNYYQFDSKKFFKVGDYSDVTYYYVNSKYFKELGYFELFPAMILADREKNNRLKNLERYRDLHTYDIVSIRHAYENAEILKGRFSPARWQAFQNDVDYFLEQGAIGGWKYFFKDHGFNPPPPWTLVGGTLSKLVSVENVKIITMIDFVLVGAMFAGIAYAFNAQTLLFALLFFLCTFSGRWPVVGQSILRFDWLATLVLSVCLLKIKRPGWAGMTLMYSSLNRIFPTIFFWPLGVILLDSFIRKRKLESEQRRFIAGALVILAGLGLGAVLVLGPQAFVESKKNLAMHGSSDSYSSHRVGLSDAIFYRGEWTYQDLKRNGGIQGKAEKIAASSKYLYGLGILSLLFIAFYALKTKKPDYSLLYLCIIPLFIMQTPQINYYNLRLLLIMTHIQDPNQTRNKIGLVMLFLIEIITQASHVMGSWRYTTTCFTSIGLTVYFLIILVTLVLELKKPSVVYE
jgi:hypothetical protein